MFGHLAIVACSYVHVPVLPVAASWQAILHIVSPIFPLLDSYSLPSQLSIQCLGLRKSHLIQLSEELRPPQQLPLTYSAHSNDSPLKPLVFAIILPS